MLKMVGSGVKNGKPVKLVVFGLSHNNLELLKARRPIEFSGDIVDLPDVQFVIFAGETEQSMGEEVYGLIGPDTDVKIDPKLRS